MVLRPEPGFPCSSIEFVLAGDDAGGPRPSFEPIDGATFTFGPAGGSSG